MLGDVVNQLTMQTQLGMVSYPQQPHTSVVHVLKWDSLTGRLSSFPVQIDF